MSSDWFCKIGEKKVGPLNGQQLKTIVAKGQLKPEHYVRRGSEGPWVPAGRIKGLFPEGTVGNSHPEAKGSSGKPASRSGAKTGTAKSGGLPSATEAPKPPAADVPSGLNLGGQDKHAALNFDKFQIDSTPVAVSRRKVKSGMQGLKKAEQKKVKTILFCLIGGGMVIGVIAIIYGAANGLFSSPKPVEDAFTKKAAEEQAANSAQPAAKDSAPKAAADVPQKNKEPDIWPRIEQPIPAGNVEVMILKPNRGAPPQGAKTKKSDVLVIRVRLNLKEGETKPIELKSWAGEGLVEKVSLKDDQKGRYDLLEQVNGAGTTITKDRMIVQLVFDAPPKDKKLKFLHLTLPGAAFHANDATIYCEMDIGDINP